MKIYGLICVNLWVCDTENFDLSYYFLYKVETSVHLLLLQLSSQWFNMS